MRQEILNHASGQLLDGILLGLSRVVLQAAAVTSQLAADRRRRTTNGFGDLLLICSLEDINVLMTGEIGGLQSEMQSRLEIRASKTGVGETSLGVSNG